MYSRNEFGYFETNSIKSYCLEQREIEFKTPNKLFQLNSVAIAS